MNYEILRDFQHKSCRIQMTDMPEEGYTTQDNGRMKQTRGIQTEMNVAPY